MNQLYVSLFFIGVTIVICSMVWIIYDRKKSSNEVRLLEEKKRELINIINDAEQMIEEMNRFSDYIVTQIDVKREELINSLHMLDRQVKNKTFQIDDQPKTVIEHTAKNEHATKDKVIPLNSKYRSVIQLAQKGLSSTEIARNLDIGKGEVQLILELNR